MRFGTIRRPAYEPLTVPELDWFNGLLNGGLRPAAYLLSGEPGSNKTTIVVLLAGKLAEAGIKLLLVLTEQTPYEVEKVFARVYGGRECVPDVVWENVEYELVDEAW
jgi:KaiC/GvpD/RAD55 family RecA-like ATPase